MAYDPEAGLRYCMEQRSKRKAEEESRREEEKRQYYAALGQEPPKERSFQEHMYVDTDKYGTMDNGTATLWYIIIMIIGAAFKFGFLIWVIASVVYFPFINRRKIRQKKWNKMQEEKKNGGNQ